MKKHQIQKTSATLMSAALLSLTALSAHSADPTWKYDASWTTSQCATFAWHGEKEQYVLGGDKGFRNNDKKDDDEGLDCSSFVNRCLAINGRYLEFGGNRPHGFATFDYTARRVPHMSPRSWGTALNGVHNFYVYVIDNEHAPAMGGEPWHHMGLIRYHDKAGYGGPGFVYCREARGKDYGIVSLKRGKQFLKDNGAKLFIRESWAGGNLTAEAAALDADTPNEESVPPYFGWDIANRFVMDRASLRGYVLDGYGGVHSFGGAPNPGTSYFGWDIARDIAITDWVSGQGYMLDGYGGIHSINGAPSVSGGGYWAGWDIARAVTFDAATRKGYQLDGYGGVHPLNGAPAIWQKAYFGWDIARDMATTDWVSGQGYVLDGYGGIHPINGAPTVSGGGHWAGWDIARAITFDPATRKGYQLDGYGGVHPLNGAPAIWSGVDFGWDIAREIVVLDWNTGEGYVLDGYGGVHALNGARNVN